MGIPQIVTKSLAAASANNICLSQIPTSGTALTINGALAATKTTWFNGTSTSVTIAQLDTQRRILLTYGSEGSARTLVVSGTNQFGNPISETLSIPSGGAGSVATVQDFYTVTSLVPGGGGWTAAVTVGTNSVGSSPWLFVNLYSSPIDFGVGATVTGTVNYSIEYTFDNPNAVGTVAGVIPRAISLNTMDAQSASADGSIVTPFLAWRLTINSGTGSVTATGIVAGVSQ